MILPQDVDIVRNEWGSYCQRITAWYVEVWARITTTGLLEDCPQHKGEESGLFLHIYGYAGEQSAGATKGRCTQDGWHIHPVMKKAMHRLHILFEEACMTVLDGELARREWQRVVDQTLMSLANRYFTNVRGVTTGEAPIASPLWRKASLAELSPEEFLVQHLCLLDDDGHTPETIGSCRHLSSSLTLIHGSGCFLVQTRRLANGRIKYAIVKVDESECDALLKGEE